MKNKIKIPTKKDFLAMGAPSTAANAWSENIDQLIKQYDYLLNVFLLGMDCRKKLFFETLGFFEVEKQNENIENNDRNN